MNTKTFKRLFGILTVMVLLGTADASPAWAQDLPDDITIALFAPSIYFEDTVARASFISTVAGAIESEIGVPVMGVNFSSAGDLDDVDFAIVDGIYFADSEVGDPLASAEHDGDTTASLGLLVGSFTGFESLADLRSSRLILPRQNDLLEDFISAVVLHRELDADEFFAEIEYTSNIESALSAVSQGRADATFGFAEYGSRGGLFALAEYDDGPMPVVVQLNDDLSDDFADLVAEAFQSISSRNPLDGFTRFDSGGLSTFTSDAARRRPSRAPLMARGRSFSMDPADVSFPDFDESLSIGPAFELIEIPTMETP